MEVVIIETPSLGDRSYLVHDGAAALVVDPQRDLDRILDAAEAAGVEITHIAETHLHNDYVSGGLALARRVGARYLHAAAEDLAFDHDPVVGGDIVEVGDLRVEVLATPGHTLHHLSYIVRDEDGPPAAFTGGSLLLGSVGRTDLVDAVPTDELTRAQFHSAHRIVSLLPDDACVYPTHGFGSFCSSAKSTGESDGTVGTEKKVNVAFTAASEDDFVEQLISGLSAHPAYYAHMAPLNAAGPQPIDLSPPAPVDPAELARRIHRGEWVVDLRQRRAFAGDHVVGTIGIELADPFATYLGWLIPWGTAVTLLADTEDEIAEAQRQLVRVGIDRPSGAADGGPDAYGEGHDRAGYAAVEFGQVPKMVEEDDTFVLDVRREDEWDEGHIAGAVHVPMHELLSRFDDVPAGRALVHCASGFRASIAASLLHRAGRDVVLIDDAYDNAADAGVSIDD
ncbi:rhodanese-like domain-containing protein [Iamia majanohamensis]|uniref:Rhodanese-like domain-containing protein n=1 Tax=Iamia majanohamensis TaxID=467976 RepID=A0AAE9Y8C2_9ACTN|nr:rhodanese-like domain-containing protein [Iamia majanohamensis]WCO66333.1 rhodanese-like domain-containing protein [Iamia majanohamensis]